MYLQYYHKEQFLHVLDTGPETLINFWKEAELQIYCFHLDQTISPVIFTILSIQICDGSSVSDMGGLPFTPGAGVLNIPWTSMDGDSW